MWFKLLKKNIYRIKVKRFNAFTLVDLLVGMAVSSIVLTTVAVFTISIYLKSETNTVREALNQIVNILAEQQKYIVDTLVQANAENIPNLDQIRTNFFPSSNNQNPLENFDIFCNGNENLYYSMPIPTVLENSSNNLTNQNGAILLIQVQTNNYSNYIGPSLAGINNSRINMQNIELRIERNREGNFIVLNTNVRYRYDSERIVSVPSYQLRINRASIC